MLLNLCEPVFLCREARGLGLLYKVMCLYILFPKVDLQTFEGKFKWCCWANLPISFMKQGVWLLSTSIKPLCTGNSQIPPGLQWNQSSRFLSVCCHFLIFFFFSLWKLSNFFSLLPHIWVSLKMSIYASSIFPSNLVLEYEILNNASGGTSSYVLLILLITSAQYKCPR